MPEIWCARMVGSCQREIVVNIHPGNTWLTQVCSCLADTLINFSNLIYNAFSFLSLFTAQPLDVVVSPAELQSLALIDNNGNSALCAFHVAAYITCRTLSWTKSLKRTKLTLNLLRRQRRNISGKIAKKRNQIFLLFLQNDQRYGHERKIEAHTSCSVHIL